MYQNTDIITPNESEVQMLTGIYPETLATRQRRPASCSGEA